MGEKCDLCSHLNRDWVDYTAHHGNLNLCRCCHYKVGGKCTAWERTGRPKPPRINSGAYWLYMGMHETGIVWKGKDSKVWQAFVPGREGRKLFPTHAEAIQYAQEVARRG